MKKIIFILLFLFVFKLPVFANEITITDETEMPKFESEDFIPQNVSESLEENEISTENGKTSESIWQFVLGAIKNSFSELSPDIGILLGIIIIISVFYRFIDNKCFKTIISYIITLIMLIQVFNIIKTVLDCAMDSLNSLSEILNAILPAFSAILLMGGSTFTSFAQSASFGAVLAFLNIIIQTLLLPCISLLMLLLMFERLSPQFSELNLLRFFKKSILTVLSFITMIMLTVITYQHIVSAGKDSISGRTVKFAASNFIPIVGSAVGESFKTVSAGLKYLKNTVGGAVILSVAVTIIPVMIKIFLVKI